MFAPFLAGFGTGAGLIIAIGAQNAHVLAHGISRRHALPVAALCALCDLALIAAGLLGMGALVSASPGLGRALALGGAVFLGWYGARALGAALAENALTARAAEDSAQGSSLGATLLATLAVTLLNPHVYLDTVVLLGSVGGQYPALERAAFGLGAGTASVAWFAALALGGRMLSGVFARPASWRVLHLLVCATMWAVAGGLLASAI